VDVGDFVERFSDLTIMALGASHQTGWTGFAAKLIQLFGLLDPQQALGIGKRAGFRQDDLPGYNRK
jgi:hypothetical protein